jgi:hypothetical protein
MTDMESRESAESSDLLNGSPTKKSSGRSRRRSRKNSTSAQGREEQPRHGERQNAIEYMLSLLTSDLATLEEKGQPVTLANQNGTLLIGLPGVSQCQNPECTTLHSGTKCPICL